MVRMFSPEGSLSRPWGSPYFYDLTLLKPTRARKRTAAVTNDIIEGLIERWEVCGNKTLRVGSKILKCLGCRNSR